jgi:hypothetical protein
VFQDGQLGNSLLCQGFSGPSKGNAEKQLFFFMISRV